MGITVNVLFDLIHQESCIFLFLQHSRQTSTLGYHLGTHGHPAGLTHMGTTFKPTLFPHGTLMYLFDGLLSLNVNISFNIPLLTSNSGIRQVW